MPKPDGQSVLADVEAERLELCLWLERLGPSDWDAPSLCDRWSVRDVVAHLTLSTRTSTLDFVKGMLRYRGNFERMEAERASARAREFSSAELIEQLRAHAGSTAHSVGSTPLDALSDLIVHGQDIARPLQRTRPTCLDRVSPGTRSRTREPMVRSKEAPRRRQPCEPPTPTTPPAPASPRSTVPQSISSSWPRAGELDSTPSQEPASTRSGGAWTRADEP